MYQQSTFVNQAASTGPDPLPKFADDMTAKSMWIRHLWGSVLGMNPKSIEWRHSFLLDWGGDTIAAVELVSLARQNGWQLTLAQVMKHHTLQEMAKVMQPSGSLPVPRMKGLTGP